MSRTEYVIGIDLGGTKLLAGLIDRELKVHAEIEVEATGDQRQLLARIATVIDELIATAPMQVAAVGCGVPCLIDSRTGIAVSAVNLPIHNLPFAKELTELTGRPVFVDNDANLAALAEHRFGTGKNHRNMLLLTVGTGIGGGIVVDGKLQRGSVGSAGELGHMVVEADGPPCQGSCPNNGCLETMASGNALAREGARLALEHPNSQLADYLRTDGGLSGKVVGELALTGDELATEAVKRIGHYLGIGLSSLINIFNPSLVAVGGGVSMLGELLLAPARTVALSRALPFSAENVQIVPARFGPEAGMIGAATLAFDMTESTTT